MNNLKVILALSYLTCFSASIVCAAESVEDKDAGEINRLVINGKDATDGQWPSMLTIEYYGANGWQHICGAVLIRNYYALTSAHCIDGYSIGDLRIWAGLLYRDTPGATFAQLLPVASYTIHQNYSSSVSGGPNDLAIIRLVSAPTFGGNVDNAALPPDDTNDFQHDGCFVAGYGRTSTSSNALSNILKWHEMGVISNADCITSFEPIDHITIVSTHICATSSPPNNGPCTGDDGGPLYCYASPTDTSVTYLAGIFSFNAALSGTCYLEYPSVSVRISKYLQWIYANTPQY